MNKPTCKTCGVTYAPIPGSDGYMAGSDGSIWTSWIERHKCNGPWRRLKTRIDKKGYERVTFGNRDNRQSMCVHRLILLAFVGPMPTGLECMHGNDVRHDNRLENLSYGTHLENIRQCVQRGRRGHRKRLKLSERDVLRIRWLYLHGARQVDLASQFRVSQQLISAICRGRVSGDIGWLSHGPEFIEWMMELQARAVEAARQQRQEAGTCSTPSDSSAGPGTTA